MSTLYLASDADTLAAKLAELVDAHSHSAGFFAPLRVVIPNRYAGQWLRLHLARKLGVAINLRFLYLENALWELLRGVDQRQHPSPPELLDHDHYRLMVLAVLWEKGAELRPLHEYLGFPPSDNPAEGAAGIPNAMPRSFWRRSWHLADRLARFIRDYEYHRQDALVQKWLRHELGYPDAAETEKSQREIFDRIVRLPDGKRALLEQAQGKVLKTLPQYAMEVMEQVGEGGAGKPDLQSRPAVHLFGIGQISALHVHTLHWLSGHYDLRLYHLSPNLKTSEVSKTSEVWMHGPLSAWGKAATESWSLLSTLQKPPQTFTTEALPSIEQTMPSSVLRSLQRDLRGQITAPDTTSLVPQDLSLQIAACPGVYREAETVYNSILFNLQHDASLKTTDIAMLATDLGKYRPVLQAVFERPAGAEGRGQRIPYNLANVTAGTSTFGQALLGFFDLAMEAFTRSRVFEVLLNPCVLARLGVERAQALGWLAWAEELGIYHSWDRKDKEERGYAATPLFTWRLGLQRLRLGRIMEPAPARPDEPASRFQGVVPYADLKSGDKEELDAFCRAVEGLLPSLFRLRDFRGSGRQWAREIQTLVQTFLAAPADRPEEAQVRDRLLQALEQLDALDRLCTKGDTTALPLALVREFVQENLESLQGARGEILTGGVTIAALGSVQPVPFRIVYILGLSEDLFPGPNALPTFDLRACERRPGDIRPAETNRYQFLEALLAARDKLYLLYNCRDLQRDQVLHPCVPLAQLRRHLQDRICGKAFAIVQIPLSASDSRYLEPAGPVTDLLVNYHHAERLLALEGAEREGRLQLQPQLKNDIEARLREARQKFEAPDGPSTGAPPAEDAERLGTISISELKRFLLCPAEAGLRRHLLLVDEEEAEPSDDEPFWTDALREHGLVVRSLESFVGQAMRESLSAAESQWRERFQALYDEWRSRCKVPEGAFADRGQSDLMHKLEGRLMGDGGLADFIRARPAKTFVGPILIGEERTPVNARTRFPALTFDVGPHFYLPPTLRLVGSWPLAWRSRSAFDLLVLSNRSVDKKFAYQLSKPLLEPLLFMMALRAGRDRLADALPSSEWLQGLPVHVHVAHADGITRLVYTPRDIAPKEARSYLQQLATDFLNPQCYDLLPFELIARSPELAAAYTDVEKDSERAGARYFEKLQELEEQDRENGRPQYWRTRLMNLVCANIPKDALEKVRRRFEPLYRGPKRNRPAEKGKKGDRVQSG